MLEQYKQYIYMRGNFSWRSYIKNLLFLAAFFIPSLAFASSNASLSLFPATGTYEIGDEFHISINVNTDEETVNAVEGEISFDPSALQVDGLSEEGSILESWTLPPEYSNTEGNIRFGGGVKSFTGDNGKIFSITFRALKNTEAKVRFSTGAAILASDGLGTNILSAMNAGVYRLVPKEVVPESPEPAGEVLGASISAEESPIHITSQSHPDENVWYSENTGHFEWTLPDNTSAVRLVISDEPKYAPTHEYPSPLREKTISDLNEGVSYFRVMAKTSEGWGLPATYRVQVDTNKPDTFRITEDGVRGTAFGLRFEGHDESSGIEKYLIRIDDGEEIEWRDSSDHVYLLPPLSPGEHVLSAKAVDFAGNAAERSITFVLDEIEPPTITDFDPELTVGSPLVVRGTARPNSNVSVWISKNGTFTKEYRTTTSGSGNFTLLADERAEKGVYDIYAEESWGGVVSGPSQSVSVMVREPKIVLFGALAIDYLSVLIPLITLILLLIFILMYGFHRLKIYRLGLAKEVEEVEEASRETFKNIRKEIFEDERILASIGTPEEKVKKEKESVKRLKKTVENAEKKVEKEIEDVKEKVVKKPTKVKAKRAK